MQAQGVELVEALVEAQSSVVGLNYQKEKEVFSQLNDARARIRELENQQQSGEEEDEDELEVLKCKLHNKEKNTSIMEPLNGRGVASEKQEEPTTSNQTLERQFASSNQLPQRRDVGIGETHMPHEGLYQTWV
jgi:hypothetical protein